MCVIIIKTTTPQTSSSVAVISADLVAAIIQYLFLEYTLTSKIAKEKKKDKTPITNRLYSICNKVRFGPQRAFIQNKYAAIKASIGQKIKKVLLVSRITNIDLFKSFKASAIN